MACPDGTGGTYCADPMTDAANCGGCGKTCAAGIACQNGTCGGGPTCPPSQPNTCGPPATPYCTNLGNDPQNCGGCGQACPAGVSCQSGLCGSGGGTTCTPDKP
jgi:hypothetical protein